MLDTMGCVLEVDGGGEGCVFACLPVCQALFSGVFHWFSGTCAPWLRRVGRVTDGAVVWIGIVGWDSLRGIVVLGVCVVGQWLSHGG